MLLAGWMKAWKDARNKRRKGRNEGIEDRLDMEMRKDGHIEQWRKTQTEGRLKLEMGCRQWDCRWLE